MVKAGILNRAASARPYTSKTRINAGARGALRTHVERLGHVSGVVRYDLAIKCDELKVVLPLIFYSELYRFIGKRIQFGPIRECLITIQLT